MNLVTQLTNSNHQIVPIERVFAQSWDVFKIFGEAALSTIAKIYDYNFVSDFVNEQYNASLGPTADTNRRAVWIIKDNSNIIGIIGGCIVGNVCQEFIWYVKPEYRKFRHGPKLLAKMEEWAKEKKCSYVLISKFKVPKESSGFMQFKEIFVRKLKTDV